MLLITRALPDSVRTGAELSEMGFDVFIEPMFEVEYLKTEDGAYNNYDVIVVTSRHGVSAMAKATDMRSVPIVAVGDRTAECAIGEGFKDVFSAGGSAADVQNYVSTYLKNQRVLYVRGVDVAYELTKAVGEQGIKIKELVVYKTVSVHSLSPRCCNLLENGKISGVVLYSVGTARIFMNLARAYSTFLKSVCAYTLSSKAADLLDTDSWKKVYVSDFPTEKSLFKLLLSTKV